MFSLIVSIIAVILTAGIAVATIYYGGHNVSSSGSRAVAEQLVNGGEHITSAGALYQNDHAGNLPSSPANGLAPYYLSSLPVPPQAAYAKGAGTASSNDWTYLQGTADVILPKLSLSACNAVNQLYGVPSIPATVDSKYIIQCYGTKEPYTFFFDPPGGNMQDAATISASLVCPTTPQVFAYTGTAQTLTMPSACSQMTVKLWGGGGGPGAYNANYKSGTGGGGGYATGIIQAVGGTQFKLLVGGAGLYGSTGFNPGGFNGGGSAVPNNGSGGGATEIQALNGTRLIVAGGGGGGTFECAYYYGPDGGAGGGLAGLDGVQGYGMHGGGGTQSAGGTSTTAPGGWLYGGNGDSSDSGGGGGYYGGGAGGWCSGAGGGSSYIGGVLNGSTVAGSGTTPGDAMDPDNAGAGKGGSPCSTGNCRGNQGRIVVYFQ